MTTYIDKIIANMATKHQKSGFAQKSPAAVLKGPLHKDHMPPVKAKPVAKSSVDNSAEERAESPPKGRIHIKAKNKGKLHEKLGVPKGKKIPAAKIEAAEHADSPALRKEAQFAENARHFAHPAAQPDGMHVHIHLGGA